MIENYFGAYKKLREHAYRSYWEKRILAEIGYLTELLYHKDMSARTLLEQAVSMLLKDYNENEQICVQTAKEAESVLMTLSEKAKSITMVCVAHAHMDMNWMWGYQETVALVLDTMRTMLTLMEEYPTFTFAQSQASVYNILEEYAPDLLTQIKQRVKEGRWEVTASTWVENDKNMSSGEAMARHLLYTKRYLSKLLDLKEEDLNIDFEPDTFGHSYNLPEILKNGGVTRYYHCRANDSNHSIYRWRGMSGAEVLAYCEPTWYNGSINSECCEGVPSFCEKNGINKVLQVYGVGDHGGGPSRRDLNCLIDMDTWPLYPTIKFGTYGEYFDYLEERREQFPVLDQELNYVFTGCYTSQSRIKMANRIGETRLTEAEIIDSIVGLIVPGYQKIGNLEGAWRKVLFNQFHDILPGSGIVETREHAMGIFQEAMAQAGANASHAMTALCSYIADGAEQKRMDDTSMGAGVGSGTDYRHSYGFTQAERGSGSVRYVTLFNVTQVTRTDPTEITLWDWQGSPEAVRVSDLEGNEYLVQFIEEGMGMWTHVYYKFLVWVPVPAVGYMVCRVDERQPENCPIQVTSGWRTDHITDEPICLENDKVKAVFDVTTMKCISFLRKSDGKELIVSTKPACGFLLITEETSNGMTSWRVGKTAKSVDLNETCCVKPEKLEVEGLRKELIYKLDTEKIRIRVIIRLDEGSEFLDYRLETVWTMLGNQEQGIPQLRFMLPCGYATKNYRYAIPYGILDRPPLAQDVPAIGLGCALPAEGGSALCLLSDSKYGFRGDGDCLSLNLIRGSYDPDPYPEIGQHIIRLAVGACDPQKENLALLAEMYTHPVITRSCASSPRKTEGCRSIFHIEGGILSAIKNAEEGTGWIVRVYNPSGEEREVKLSMPGRKIEAYCCDFLEKDLRQVFAEDGEQITYTLSGNEIGSFRIICKEM